VIPVDDIKGNDTALYVADTIDGTTYRALSAIPNATNSFHGAIIPKPAALSLLALVGLTVMRRRRKK